MKVKDQPHAPALGSPTLTPTRSAGALAADLTMPIALGGGGLFVVIQAQGIAVTGGYSPVGPSFFPTLIGTLMLLLAPVLAIGAWRSSGAQAGPLENVVEGQVEGQVEGKAHPSSDAASPERSVARIAPLGWLLAAVAIGALGIERVGFVPAMTAAFVLASQAFPSGPGGPGGPNHPGSDQGGSAGHPRSAGAARRLLGDVVVALIFALTTWFLFTVGLGLRLPAGWLSALPGA